MVAQIHLMPVRQRNTAEPRYKRRSSVSTVFEPNRLEKAQPLGAATVRTAVNFLSSSQAFFAPVRVIVSPVLSPKYGTTRLNLSDWKLI